MGPSKSLLSVAGLAAISSAILACCVTYGPHPVSLVDEKAIIIWNPEINLQHFIRQASFKGQAKDFGFIVPTPHRPTLEVADAQAFARLVKYVPRTPTKSQGGIGGPTGGRGGGVQVIEQKRVGDYLATTLKATDGKVLNDWLKANGYVSRPAMTPWLDHYAKQNFYFAALKFVRELGQETPETSALRISFATDVPFYPYKMPSDTWPTGYYRPMALYFVGPAKPRVNYRETWTEWEARAAFSGPMKGPDVAGLAKEVGLKFEDMPSETILTAYVNTRNAQGYGHDLSFFLNKPEASIRAHLAAAIGLGRFD